MLIIGERINTSRKKINEAVEKRDSDFILSEVKAQLDGGADIIDVNAGSRFGSELDDLLWLIDIIQQSLSIRLSIDSTDPNCMRIALERVKEKPMINSITAEKARFEGMAKVVQDRNCDIIGLCMDERGLPKSVEEVIENANKLVMNLEKIGIKRDNIYLDPSVQAISVNQKAGLIAIESIERIYKELPGVKTICGLSNISYSLPKRHLINRTFLTLLLKAGLSAAIIDPVDRKLVSTLKAANLILGRDPYCRNYLTSFREGKLED
jgi:5-methyltetrahydrofolate--homocysteine methyltransferase